MARTWFGWSRRWVHRVDEGRVRCELRGEAELDECATCPWLLELRLDEEVPAVLCRPDAARYAERLGGF
jgi:hypothetical protein